MDNFIYNAAQTICPEDEFVKIAKSSPKIQKKFLQMRSLFIQLFSIENKK